MVLTTKIYMFKQNNNNSGSNNPVSAQAGL
jgi:hypothetical protein